MAFPNFPSVLSVLSVVRFAAFGIDNPILMLPCLFLPPVVGAPRRHQAPPTTAATRWRVTGSITPRSHTSALISRAGVTSKAGL